MKLFSHLSLPSYRLPTTDYRSAFSLIEVLIFTTILSLFFVTASAVVVVSLRAAKASEQKIVATHFAEELSDWLRSEKETNWNIFVVHAGATTGSSTTFCFNDPGWSTTGTCDAYELGNQNQFKRYMTLTRTSDFQATAAIIVTWKNVGIGGSGVSINTIYSLWE